MVDGGEHLLLLRSLGGTDYVVGHHFANHFRCRYGAVDFHLLVDAQPVDALLVGLVENDKIFAVQVGIEHLYGRKGGEKCFFRVSFRPAFDETIHQQFSACVRQLRYQQCGNANGVVVGIVGKFRKGLALFAARFLVVGQRCTESLVDFSQTVEILAFNSFCNAVGYGLGIVSQTDARTDNDGEQKGG